MSRMAVSPDNKYLTVWSGASQETIVYSLQKSRVLHEERETADFAISSSHILMLKTNQTLIYSHGQEQGVRLRVPEARDED